MSDSMTVFPPGYRLTDADTGAPISGATISFYNAGTTTPKTVYADQALEIPLGTSVITDSLGRPTSDGSTAVDVYVGTESYKITIADEDGVIIETKDDRPGAPQTVADLNPTVISTTPVVTKSADYSVLAADQNTSFSVNCTAADVNITLPSAVTVGSGWKVKVGHSGTGNQIIVKVATGSGQTISEGPKLFGGAFSFGLFGEDADFVSDGGNWRVFNHTAPFVKLAQGIIPVTDRVSAAPSTPQPAALYLSTSAATWAGVSVANNDIVQWSGTAWVPFTPYAGCGWTVYIQDELRNYQFVNGFWLAQPLSVPVLQADMEAATPGFTVTPNMQKYHPLHPKAICTYASGTGLTVNVGFSSVTRNSTGSYTFGLSPAMSSVAYTIIAQVTGSNVPRVQAFANSASSLNVVILDNTGSAADPTFIYLAIFGDQ